jgi:hypothetical protein
MQMMHEQITESKGDKGAGPQGTKSGNNEWHRLVGIALPVTTSTTMTNIIVYIVEAIEVLIISAVATGNDYLRDCRSCIQPSNDPSL